MLSVAVEYERRKAGLQSLSNPVNYRGNLRNTWAPAELQHVKLPVNAIAYSLCPTSRDLYFEHVVRLRRRPSWLRYAGCVVDRLYKQIFNASRSYCQATSARDFDLYAHLTTKSDGICGKATRSCRNHLRALDLPPSNAQQETLAKGLRKIVRYEALQISSLMEFELARVPDSTPDTVFTQFFSFILDERLKTLHHGFSSPATPDFILRDRIVGDIKYGAWKDYFEYTVVAYALAYEEHHNQPIDLGSVLQVELLESRPFPCHFGAHIDILDDFKRKRFLMMRDRKLQIVAERIDPGRAASPDECDPNCDFYERCWGK